MNILEECSELAIAKMEEKTGNTYFLKDDIEPWDGDEVELFTKLFKAYLLNGYGNTTDYELKEQLKGILNE